MKRISLVILGAFLMLSASAVEREADRNGKGLDLGLMLQPIPESSCLQDPDYFIWGGSMVKDDEGTYHIFYSRWKKEYGFAFTMTVLHSVMRCILNNSDYTPIGFTRPGSTTLAHQLATAFAFTSPLTIVAEHVDMLLNERYKFISIACTTL